MNIAELQGLLDTYGGDLSRWPSEQRKKAEILLAISEDAKYRFEHAQQMDVLFEERMDEDMSMYSKRSMEDLFNKIDEFEAQQAEQKKSLVEKSKKGVNVLDVAVDRGSRFLDDLRSLFTKPVIAMYVLFLVVGFMSGSWAQSHNDSKFLEHHVKNLNTAFYEAIFSNNLESSDS